MFFVIKQYLKMAMQNVYLPFIYRCYCRRKVQKGKVIFADARGTELPFSMRSVYTRVKGISGCQVQTHFCNFQKLSQLQLLKVCTGFMKEYATAEYVFICDNYLPVSSCRKRKETTVVQLWHSGGLMKKMAYDTPDDIPRYYRGNVYRNYDLVTVSAPLCEKVWAGAMRIPENTVKALGLSRTDIYFSEKWNEDCRKRFYDTYPEAKGKKVVLWAPTFRGNAGMPTLEGVEAMEALRRRLGPDYFLIFKVHPHLAEQYPEYGSPLPAEQMFPAVDVLITDYSSVLYDFMVYRKPIVLFAPDYEEYQKNRGFYVEYESFPFPIAKSSGELHRIFEGELWKERAAACADWYEAHMGACDGHATGRILEEINLL